MTRNSKRSFGSGGLSEVRSKLMVNKNRLRDSYVLPSYMYRDQFLTRF